MRMTTKIIQTNSLRNININKMLQDKLSNQMASEKKVNRPSDDPVIAIRALRLRTNVNQIVQYYEKNAPDAESWLKLTEGAISSMTEVITDMYENATRGSNEELKLEDRETILTALKSLRDEVYSTGNTDYAGRYIFTGYRTDSSLTYTEATQERYSITEQIENIKIDQTTYVDTRSANGDILDINEVNFNQAPQSDIRETDVTTSQINRIRLSYQDISDEDDQGTAITNPVKIQLWNANANNGEGAFETQNITCTSVSLYAANSPYAQIVNQPDGMILVKETGELLLGTNVYNRLMALKNDPETKVNEGEIRLIYEKKDWKKDDLKPEHYFACTKLAVPNVGDIVYNEKYLDGIEEKQAIEYDVGLNQRIRVNTTADELFTHDIRRDVDDMIAAMEESVSLEKMAAKLSTMIEEEKYANAGELETLEYQLAATQKALTFSKEKTQKLYEGCITKMQGHLDTVNLATTQNGTRSQRLELISNRLMSQKTNFETLKSENEDADITEVAIQLSSAELTYNAALMATGKVLQNSLMNFI